MKCKLKEGSTYTDIVNDFERLVESNGGELDYDTNKKEQLGKQILEEVNKNHGEYPMGVYWISVTGFMDNITITQEVDNEY